MVSLWARRVEAWMVCVRYWEYVCVREMYISVTIYGSWNFVSLYLAVERFLRDQNSGHCVRSSRKVPFRVCHYCPFQIRRWSKTYRM